MNDLKLDRPVSGLDLDKYRPFLAHLGLSREAEGEMIATLGAFLSGCIDRAFGHDPIQLVAGDRLQLSDEGRNPPVIRSEPIPKNKQQALSSTFETAIDLGQRKR